MNDEKNIFFAIKIMLNGACTTLSRRATALNLTDFTPFEAAGLHITLRFVSKADPTVIRKCVAALTYLSTTQFSLRLGAHLGYFPESGIIYASVDDVEGKLGQLRDELSELLKAGGVQFDTSFDTEEPAFHISLGRWDPKLADGEVANLPPHSPNPHCTINVSRVHLLTGQDRTYKELGWEHLDLNEHQLKQRAGNRVPPRTKTGHPATT
jgi:2'-5' RNA ligase